MRTRLEINHLKAFVAIAETGQLTRAADRLHLSQPAVSGQIKALEDELGQQLFQRSSSGMEITPIGRDLLIHAERVLRSVEELRRAAQTRLDVLTGKVRIGTLSDPQFLRLGEFSARTIERYPAVEIELHNDFTGAAFDAVRSSALDASFYFGEISDPHVAGLQLGEMAYRVAAPAAWSERLGDADWNEVAAMPWILAPVNSTLRQLTLSLFGQHGAAPTKSIEADNENVIANLVESDVGLSLVREDLALARERVGAVAVWGQARIATPLWFIYLRDRAREPLLAALLSVLEEIWSADTPPAARSTVRKDFQRA